MGDMFKGLGLLAGSGVMLAHAIEKMRFLFAICLVLIVFSSVSLQAASPSVAAITPSNSQTHSINPADTFYIGKMNELRKQAGLAGLAHKPSLERSSYNKARNMLANNYWGHYSPYGESFSDFIWRESPGSSRVGENLARCFVSRDLAFRALVESPTHYAIMTGDFTNVGVSELTNSNDGCVYAVFHFSKN